MHWSTQLTLALYVGTAALLVAWLAYQSGPRLDRAIGWFDAIMMIIMIAYTILLMYSRHAAFEEAERTGLYTDVGVAESVLITLYSVPAAVLSAAAWAMMWTRFPPRYVVQALATLCVLWYPVTVLVDIINDWV